MRARDVMTRQVYSLALDASVYDAARLLLTRGISAAPVLTGDGVLAGIVSEADLMRRAELGTEQHRSWLVRLLGEDDVSVAADYIRSHARKVADVMTRNVVTAGEEATLGQIAVLMEGHRVKRIPIVKDGKPVGIVSRADLLRGLLAYQAEAKSAEQSDEGIRAAVTAELEKYNWSSIWLKNVIVENGVVHLWGAAQSQTEKDACRVAVETVPGVKRIENHLVVLRNLAGAA